MARSLPRRRNSKNRVLQDVYARYVSNTRFILVYEMVGELIESISAFHTPRDSDEKF